MSEMNPFLSDMLDGLGVEYAELRLEETERTGITFRGRELDDIGRSFERGGCLRVFHRGNWGVGTFNAIDDSIRELARDVAARVEQMPERDEKLVPLAAEDQVVRLPEDHDPGKVPLEEKHGLIRHYNDIMLQTDGIATTVSRYQDAHRFVVFYSTEDRYLDQEFVQAGFACRAVAKDGSNIQDYGDSFGKTQGFASLRNREPLVERIAGKALELLGAEPVKAGRYDVIIDPLLAGVFVHEAFGHLSEADHFSENERLREMMATGTRFGVDELTVVDDATMPGERGTFEYDDEGVHAQKSFLIRHGLLAGHLHDRQTARSMSEPASGNGRALSYRFPPVVRMTNTYIEPREAQLEDMMDTMEDGLYVIGSRGGMTELESFTFSSQYAYLVEHGRQTKMVRDVTLSGNVFETMKNIESIGDDLVMFGGIGGCGKAGQGPLPVGLGAPHVKVKNVVIGGE